MEGFFQQYLRVYRPMITALNELLEPHQLSYSLWQVMYYIEKNGPATLVEVAAYYEVEKPAITRRVHQLEELQLVEHIPGKDRRVKVIALTETGKAVYRECRERITDLEHRVTDGLSRDDQQTLAKILLAIRENMMARGAEHDE